MASEEPQVVAETSGSLTREYCNISDKLQSFKRALQADGTATETLTTKFKSAKWIDMNAKDVGPKELLEKALDMVENSTKYYYTFKEMVQDTTGLHHILPNFKAAQESNPEQPKQDLVVSGMESSGTNKRLPQLSEQDLGHVSSQVLSENESDVPVATKSHLQSSETPSSTPTFQVGELEVPEDKENADKIEPVEVSEHTPMQEAIQEESCDGDSPVTKYTFDPQHAKGYLSKDMIAMVSDQEQQVRVLTEEKQALIHEVEELKSLLQKAEEDADEKEVEANQKYKQKVNELEECKKKFSDLENEKREMEHDQDEKIMKLERGKKRKREEEKSKYIVLRQEFAKANQKLTKKQNKILKQKIKIQTFEHKSYTLQDYDTTIMELKERLHIEREKKDKSRKENVVLRNKILLLEKKIDKLQHEAELAESHEEIKRLKESQQ